MRRRIYVTLDPREASALLDLAQQEDRDPRRQAARLIREALERYGALEGLRAASSAGVATEGRGV